MSFQKKTMFLIALIATIIVVVIITMVYNTLAKDLCEPGLIEEFKITEVFEPETMETKNIYELTLNLPSPCHTVTVGSVFEYDEEGNIDYEKTLEDNKISILIFDPHPRCSREKTQVTYRGNFVEEQVELETKIYCMHRGDSELIFTK